MPKLDVSSLPRLAPATETRTFTDPLQPGQELEITLLAYADYGLSLAANDLANEKYELHVTGKTKNGKFVPPAPLPRIPNDDSGHVPRLSRGLCNTIATLGVLQSGETTYTFLEWLALSVLMPNAFGKAVQWAGDVLSSVQGPEEDDPNDSADLSESI